MIRQVDARGNVCVRLQFGRWADGNDQTIVCDENRGVCQRGHGSIAQCAGSIWRNDPASGDER